MNIVQKYETGFAHMLNNPSLMLVFLVLACSISIITLTLSTIVLFIVWESPNTAMIRAYFIMLVFALTPFYFSKNTTEENV